MASITDVAKKFFDECEAGKGWGRLACAAGKPEWTNKLASH